jgi:Ni,Fe-hydrogenase I small subunit
MEEIEVLWLTAGLGCDGESVAIAAATQPSIEDLVPGAEGCWAAFGASHETKWLFGATLHEGCGRGGYYEQGDFASRYWGPVIQCNVGKRGWINGIGAYPNVGGVCIGCTMPGFPDRLMPFLSQPPGSLLSARAITNYEFWIAHFGVGACLPIK